MKTTATTAQFKALEEENERLKQALSWLLDEYHYMSRKMTEINNIVQPLWGDIRERRGDYQLIEDFIEQIKEKGIDEALEKIDPVL